MSEERRGVGYSPGLDGLRGVCLAGVLLFHAPFEWMSGGFLGVSTFFTLSGYLITSLLLVEWERQGRIDFRKFWSRRLRRLGPALWLGVVATVLSSPLWAPEPIRERLAWDALSSVTFLSNWRFMTPDYAYSKLFTDPSPLQHCWSLAIEAQYYLVFPLLLSLLLRRARLAGVAAGLAGLAVASVLASWAFATSSEAEYRSYYGTDTRAAEILVGALVAVAGRAGWLTPLTSRGSRAGVLGAVGLLGTVLTWVVTEVESPLLYRGGFGLYSLLSACTLLAAIAAKNPVGSLLSHPSLVWLGRISYGAYVYHWPIFLWLDPDLTGLGPTLLFAVRTLTTLFLAAVSYRFLEEPVRYGRGIAGRLPIAAAAAGMAGVVFVFATHLQPGGWHALSFPTHVDEEAGAVADDRVLSFAMFGDSVALNLLSSLSYRLTSAGMKVVRGRLSPGCALVEEGIMLTKHGWSRDRPGCRDWVERWGQIMGDNPADVAVILTGTWDILDRRFPGREDSLVLGDAELDAILRSQMVKAVEGMRQHGVKLVWLTCPRMYFWVGKDADNDEMAAASDPARVDRYNEILRSVAAEFPDDMRVIEFGDYPEASGGDDGPDLSLRDDGVHYTRKGRLILSLALLPEVLEAARDLVPHPPPTQ